MPTAIYSSVSRESTFKLLIYGVMLAGIWWVRADSMRAKCLCHNNYLRESG